MGTALCRLAAAWQDCVEVAEGTHPNACASSPNARRKCAA
jgi:hypothetical protein